MSADDPGTPRGGGLLGFYKKYAFTLWVLVAVTASMSVPGAFRSWFGTDLKVLIVPLIQIITFGMGTTLSPKDFRNVLIMPWPVFIGVALQFIIMPLVGFTIAMTFGFPPEVAAGVILIGSVSSGVASNVMTYLAGGNVPLSVTITSMTTLLSPLVTPFWMKTLAGRLVPVDFMAMMLSIFNMIIIPIVAGLLANRLLYGTKERKRPAVFLAVAAFVYLALGAAAAASPPFWWERLAVLKPGVFLGFLLLGLTALAKLVIGVLLKGPANWMDKALPIVSMAGICLIIAVITAQSREPAPLRGPAPHPGGDRPQRYGIRFGLRGGAPRAPGRERLPGRGHGSRDAERGDGLGDRHRRSQEHQCGARPGHLRAVDERLGVAPRRLVAPAPRPQGDS